MPPFCRRRPFLSFSLTILLGGVAIFFGCRSSPTAQAPWFLDVTEKVGLNFSHDPGPTDGSYFMPQICGSGAALFDFDGDGRLDIYLLHNAGPKSASTNKLFQQQPDGTFKDVSAGSGLDFAGFCMAAIVADVNNDGLPDLYVTEHGGRGGRLFLNKGNGKFEEIVKSGIANPSWSTAASFMDYDGDGWLDLVVVNYVDLSTNITKCTSTTGGYDYCSPHNYKGTVTRLYRNKGKDAAGTWLGFEERTKEAGLEKTPGPGLGVLCADLNGDGWPDIFVANDGRANHLWINQKDGTFKEEAVSRGVAFNYRGEMQANMGIAYGDVNGDGYADILVTHLAQEFHGMWKQHPDNPGHFSDVSGEVGLTQAHWRGTGWGTVLADFNHDGALDLAIVNGKVARTGPETNPFWLAYSDRNQVFANDGKGKFLDISEDNPDLCLTPNAARGLAVGDINGDGALDLLVTQIGGKARIFYNVAPDRGHWLMVKAFDPKLKRDAIGAEVRIQVGSRRMQRLVQTSLSYMCSHDPRVHFGLGVVTNLEYIEVLWPGGAIKRFPCDSVDKVVVVERGKGTAVPAKSDKAP